MKSGHGQSKEAPEWPVLVHWGPFLLPNVFLVCGWHTAGFMAAGTCMSQGVREEDILPSTCCWRVELLQRLANAHGRSPPL